MSKRDDRDTDTTTQIDNNNPDPNKRGADEERASDEERVEKQQQQQRPTPNPLRCPFAPRTESMKQNFSRNNKRTQRYRSTAQSRLGDMTVGDIRYCFQQLRNAGDSLTSEMILYNGQCAGEFALQYLQETSSATKKRRKNSPESKGKSKDAEADNRFSRMNFPSSQLVSEGNVSKNEQRNILEF